MTEATKARPGQDDLEVRLSKGATLHGAARRRDGAPAIGAIEVATPLGPLFRVAAVDPDGNYRLEGLRPGTYALRCTDETALGFEESEAGKKAVGRTTALVQVEANASVRCDLTGTARVRGTLKADGKLPMSLGLILARGSGEQPAAFRRSLFSGRDYVFQGIPPGSYGLFISPGGKAENVLLGQVEVEADSEEVVLNAKVPASLVKDLAASRKAAQRKLMDKLGLDPSVLDDLDDDAAKDDDGAKAKRAEEDAADRADAELKTRLSKDLVVEPEVEKGRVTLDYPLSAPDELADFKVRGFAKARVGTVDGGAFYGSGIDLTAARRPATLLHSLELSGDVSVSLELVVFSRSPRSKLCVLLSKKVGVAWGQTICKPKSLKPYKRQRPADLSVFNGQESVKLEIRRKGDVLTVRCQGRLAGKHSFKKGELDSFRFGLFLDGVRVVVERLRLEGDVN
jgi:hypothetical protein